MNMFFRKAIAVLLIVGIFCILAVVTKTFVAYVLGTALLGIPIWAWLVDNQLPKEMR
jgi:hypothetical protein